MKFDPFIILIGAIIGLILSFIGMVYGFAKYAYFGQHQFDLTLATICIVILAASTFAIRAFTKWEN